MASLLFAPLILVMVFGSSVFLNLRKNNQLIPYAKLHLAIKPIDIKEFSNYMTLRQKYFPEPIKERFTQLCDDYLWRLNVNRDLSLLNIWELGLHSVLVEPLELALFTKIISVHYLLYPKNGLLDKADYPRIVLKSHLYMRHMDLLIQKNPRLAKKLDCGVLIAINSLHHIFLSEIKEIQERLFVEISKQILESYSVHHKLNKDIEKLRNSLRSNGPNRRSQIESQRKRYYIYMALFLLVSSVSIFFYYLRKSRS